MSQPDQRTWIPTSARTPVRKDGEVVGYQELGYYQPAAGYARHIEAKITGLEVKVAKSTLSWIDKAGLGVIGVIIVATSWASIYAWNQEQEAANVPKAEQPMPPGYRYIDMPNGQPDVITFCDLGNRVYRDAYGHTGETIAVVPNDPTCAER